MHIACEICNGSGKCAHCSGTGLIHALGGKGEIVCVTCRGGKECAFCGGTGRGPDPESP